MNQLMLFRKIIVVYLKIICNRNTVRACVTYIIKSLQADNVRWLQSTDVSVINSCVHHQGSEGSDIGTLMMKTQEALHHGRFEPLDTADMSKLSP